MLKRSLQVLALCAVSMVSTVALATTPATISTSLAELAPAANPEALALAQAAMQCAQANGTGVGATRLTVIDYSLPSLTPRLWVFDLAKNELLFEELVAHGQNTGDNFARRFSNDDGSHQSSLGLFLTAGTYQGSNGYSLRLEGLEPGTNDRAMERAIVMHGAPYVNPALAKTQGRLGRSWGCPALRPEIAATVIDTIKGGNFIFSYYPDKAWLQRSALLKCEQAKTMLAAVPSGSAVNGAAAP